jgi:hypothetical protein
MDELPPPQVDTDVARLRTRPEENQVAGHATSGPHGLAYPGLVSRSPREGYLKVIRENRLHEP